MKKTIGIVGGGYCHGGHGRPTYILLNWADELRSLTTLAHEMGHGVHAELSKTQNVFHEKHPISIAEVASTLFENFVFDEIIDGLSFEEQIYARFNKLQEVMGSVFRQGAYINYELEIHKQINKKGSISAENFAEIMQTELQKHLGPAFNITRDDGYLWVRYMHARWFFYSYSYAYGTLISTVLYKKYKQDKTFITKINQFLSAGGSDTPENIFKSIGIDTSKSEFWKIGLQAIHDEVIELEKMIKKLNK
jgi:oligoendopeptidase F